jgi:glycogen debranching enzyme
VNEGARVSFPVALDAVTETLERRRREYCEVTTSNQQFNDWLSRSASDLRMMATETEAGTYIYAGVPWFSAPFGRDGIIAALEALTLNPSLAAGVLRYLAATQATEFDAEHDAEPGKILHEARGGEMAALGEIPFRRYYGSIDSTPLFLMLAGAYHRRTGDAALIEEIWPHLLAALAWLDDTADVDGDGFIEYAPKATHGLINQGWKDSHDSVFHADGSLARGPIALCEVQGYAYAAHLAIGHLASSRREYDLARAERRRAAMLRKQFDEQFWSDSLKTYAIALDGNKLPCLVQTSNAGQTLYTGIARKRRGAVLARSLLAPDMFAGWGIRTLSSRASRFNPMSYHNGSIWPHDNALIASGLSRYGHGAQAVQLLSAMFDAAQYMDLKRMPELFCGFERREGQGPTHYPVACLPQSWAAGAVFMLLDACLGLTIDAPARRIRFSHPALPRFLDEVTISDLIVGNASVDIQLRRDHHSVQVALKRTSGRVDLLIEN